MNATCRANETCRKVLNTGKHYCECVPGTVLVKNNRTHEERCLGMFDMIITIFTVHAFQDFKNKFNN